ncbi:unnamed protein product [Angiostrongylus costaricensis]|uniref:WS_DGAT_C domain-containing protein n=1 Tax=Angiostrongylus costaricensis TaxID=334426 RepID=A0A0R3PLF6_ANGCS|nr:unnamed protein product [Angiostrongylus costaricensis]
MRARKLRTRDRHESITTYVETGFHGNHWPPPRPDTVTPTCSPLSIGTQSIPGEFGSSALLLYIQTHSLLILDVCVFFRVIDEKYCVVVTCVTALHFTVEVNNSNHPEVVGLDSFRKISELLLNDIANYVDVEFPTH